MLDEASYECGGKQWNGSGVKRLLAAAERHISVVSRDKAWGAGRSFLSGLKVDLACVPDGWDDSLPEVHQVITKETAPVMLPATEFLVSLLRLGVIGRLLIPEPSVLDDGAPGVLLLGEARAAGATVLLAGETAAAADESDSAATSALVAARLHRALRYHDSSTVTTDLDALAATELMSWEETVAQATERRRAQYLAHLAIPTRKGTGTWSPSAVRRFRP